MRPQKSGAVGDGDRVFDEQGGQLYGEDLIHHHAGQGKAHRQAAAEAEDGGPPLPVAGGVVVGQQGQDAVGHTGGEIEGEHVQLFDDAQGGHGLGGVFGHKFALGGHRHYRQGVLQGGGQANGQDGFKVHRRIAQAGGRGG